MEVFVEAIGNYIKPYTKVGIAFSGGVDSSLLLKVCAEVLGPENVMAFTVKSPYIPEWEVEEAVELAREIGVAHQIIPLGIPKEIEENPENRCYLCKKIVFAQILEAAEKNGFSVVCDGTNFDDTQDYRPGLLALAELGVLSPLKKAGMTKQDIRNLSKFYGLPTWNKPPYACLLTRIPYDIQVTPTMLRQIESAEVMLMNLGIKGVRVRHHGDVARIEVAQDEMFKILNIDLMKKIHEMVRQLGFKFVTLDMGGYQTGCYNEGLKTEA